MELFFEYFDEYHANVCLVIPYTVSTSFKAFFTFFGGSILPTGNEHLVSPEVLFTNLGEDLVQDL